MKPVSLQFQLYLPFISFVCRTNPPHCIPSVLRVSSIYYTLSPDVYMVFHASTYIFLVDQSPKFYFVLLACFIM